MVKRKRSIFIPPPADIQMAELKKPPDPNLPAYKTIKSSLQAVLKNPRLATKIDDAVCTVDKIVTRSLMFLKLYLIHNKNDLPLLFTTTFSVSHKIITLLC